MYLGDYAAGSMIDFKFPTLNLSGVPTTLLGTPAISVYKANLTTQSVAGVALTVDFDSLTGLNHVRLDTSADGTFYAAGSQYDVVITAGLVNLVSVVGQVVGRFTLGAVPAAVKAAVIGHGVLTLEQTLVIMAARLAGKTSGNQSGAPVCRDLDDTRNVVSGTIDTNKNRTAVTLNP